jgi:magnesium-transporting ATPase (P-type)
MEDNKNMNEERHAWSRHYDNLLWTVTGIFAGANGGLIIYVYSGVDRPWIVYVAGIVFTILPVFFAASFRSARKTIHNDMDEDERMLARGSSVLIFKQWWIFVAFWLAVLYAWYYKITDQHPIYNKLWGWLFAGCAITILSLAVLSYLPRKKKGSA